MYADLTEGKVDRGKAVGNLKVEDRESIKGNQQNRSLILSGIKDGKCEQGSTLE